jgi:fatty acid desaturase
MRDALRLLVFPTAEAGFTVLAWVFLWRRPWLSMACMLLAAVALSYSLHIVFHEVVHRRYFRHPLSSFFFESLISILLGTPFSEYRQSHWRHHRYTNLLEDATCTWAPSPGHPRPRRFWSYSLGWPAISIRSIRALLYEKRSGHLSNAVIGRIIFEGFMLITLHILLAYFVPALWIAYTVTIYLGLSCISAINYLQHPPREYGTGYTTSYDSSTYNAIFYNNGLHFEHHDRMQQPIIELIARPGSGRLYQPSAVPGTYEQGWIAANRFLSSGHIVQ